MQQCTPQTSKKCIYNEKELSLNLKKVDVTCIQYLLAFIYLTLATWKAEEKDKIAEEMIE